MAAYTISSSSSLYNTTSAFVDTSSWFEVRPARISDARDISIFEQFVAGDDSFPYTSEPAGRWNIMKEIGGFNLLGEPYFVARATSPEILSQVQKARTRKKDQPSTPVLGYAVLAPYKPGIPRFDRTAQIQIAASTQLVLGETLYRQVIKALVGQVLSHVKAKPKSRKTVMANTYFEESNPELLARRDVLIRDCGFRIVGRFEHVSEVRGVLLDSLQLQIDI